MTLVPEPGGPPAPPTLCVVCGGLGVQDIILNVLLFLPFGLGLRLAGVSWWRAVAIAAGTSLAIELLQMRVVTGRDASLGDLLTNSVGGVAGVVLADEWRRLLLPTARTARRAAWCWVGVSATVLALTSWGERTSLPRTTYWGQWTPELLYMDHFPGTLLGSWVGGIPFPQGAMGDSPAFRALLSSDSVLVVAEVRAGAPTSRMAPIASVFDWRRTEIFLLGQNERDLVFTMRANAARARVRNPAIRLDDVFPADARADGAATPLRLEGGKVHGELVAGVWQGGAWRERRVPLTPGLGWSYFSPFEYAFGAETPLISAIWLAGLLLPLGYWGGAVDSRRERVVMALAAALALALAGPLLGEHAAAWWEWAGAAVGVVGGLACRMEVEGRRASADDRRLPALALD